jgi:hypothetical protein
MEDRKPGFYENTSLSPVDSGQNPVYLVGVRKFGLLDFPEVRQGINSLAHSECRLKTNCSANSNFQSATDDFCYETGVFNPCRAVGISNYQIIELSNCLIVGLCQGPPGN